MSDVRALAAIERIEQALGRIEAAAAPPAPPVRDSAEYRGLAARHERLRGEVEQAIRGIDQLLAAEQG